MSKIKERVIYWSQLFLLPIYGLSFLFPRDKKIWLFGSTFGRRFADSPRYFYLYLSQQGKFGKEKNIRPIWLTDNDEIVDILNKEGYECYKRGTLKAYWFALRGGVYLYDNYPKDISHWLSGGAKKINLWHGIPLKKIQNDNLMDKIRHPNSLWKKWKAFPRRLSDEKSSHYILATSDFYRPIYESAFKTKNAIVNRYPRTDIFTHNVIYNVYLKEERDSLNEIENKLKDGMKIILYMPTFRESETDFFNIVNIEKLQEYLKNNNYLLCLKLHCKSKLRDAFSQLNSENVVVINQNADPYIVVDISDLLITDYSSIYFDYLLTKKPIVFFCYDLKTYLEKSRDMYFDYNDFTPGEKAYSQKELEEAIKKAFENDMYLNYRDELLKKVFVEQRGLASSNLKEKIEAL